MVDQFNRVHDYLRISLTERCNLRCFYCMPEDGIQLRPKSEFMSANELVSIAKTFVGLGVKKIRLTGGEPLVRNDATEIIKRLSELPIELAITTNAVLVDKFIDTFKQCGLKSVNVSLDSLQEEKLNQMTRRKQYNQIFSNINLLLDNNFHVKLNAVIMRGHNDDELTDFVEFTKNRNVHFRFIEFMPFDGNNWNINKGLSFLEMMEPIHAKYGEAVRHIEDSRNDTAKNFKIDGYQGTFAVISSVTKPFCDNCNRLRLTADGKMKNCLFSQGETDLLSLLRKGEDLVPAIMQSVKSKQSERGGIISFEDFTNPDSNRKNRSMVSIGG